MSAPLRLDRSRYFSTVHPPEEVSFVQDGFPFDASGALVEHLLTSEQRRSIGSRLARSGSAPVEPTPDPATAPAQNAGPAEEPDPEGQDNGAPVNLEAWLRGEAKWPWFSLSKAIRERYHRTFASKADAVEFLLFEQNIIPLHEVAEEHAPPRDP